MSNELDVRPLTTNSGAEIFGVDLAEPYAPEVYADIRAAMHRYGVVFSHINETLHLVHDISVWIEA